MTFWIINGPNLNMLGNREPEFYGNVDFDTYLKSIEKRFSEHSIHYFQSNHEGALIDKMQEVYENADGIVLNAAAYTHTSIAIADCVAAIDCPVVEVHISDIDKREDFRKNSFLNAVCDKTIQGIGLAGYDQAIQWLIEEKSN